MRILKENQILIFFLFLLGFTFTSFFSFDFSDYEVNRSHEELPHIEASHFVLNRFDDKMIEINISGSRAMQYSDRDIFQDFKANRVNDNKQVEMLNGSEVIFKDNVYNFPKGVDYSNDSGLSFFSQSGIYDVSKNIFYGSGEFTINNPDMTTNGLDIVYNKNTEEISAKNISAKISF